jgi:hypothetical protein
VTVAAVLAAAGHGTMVAQTGSVTAGGGGLGASPGTGAVPHLTAAGHVVMMSFPWRGLAVLGALAVLAAGALVTWRGARWPVMSSRYDRPGRAQPGAGPATPGADPATLWESLSKGLDPTEFGGPDR